MLDGVATTDGLFNQKLQNFYNFHPPRSLDGQTLTNGYDRPRGQSSPKEPRCRMWCRIRNPQCRRASPDPGGAG